MGVSDKPPLPKVHTTGLANNKKTPAASTNQTIPINNSEKPQVPRRTHKPTSQKVCLFYILIYYLIRKEFYYFLMF